MSAESGRFDRYDLGRVQAVNVVSMRTNRAIRLLTGGREMG